MNKAIIVSFLALLILPLQASADSHGKALYAVKFHADWCGSCKAIAPQLEKARGKHDLDSLNVLFVTLDLTNKITKNQAKLHAHGLGLGDFYEQNGGKTGFIALINASTGELLGKITKEHKADDIAAMVKEKASSL